ncbi:MAG: 3-oxoacyl-ACP reductase FabG [Clostridia bacterium]|nr:3-oxoacyl-ACP reductase FabG [Clostridia bacterium]
MRLQNKIAMVTGGSRGIGYATVEAFLREGATVVLCASRKETAEKAVQSLKSNHPDACVEGIYPDLSSFDEVKCAVDDIVAKYGRIDILVNNAGVSESTPFDKYSTDVFDKVMDLNVKGIYNCSKAVCDPMTAQGSGVILNTSSMVSISGQPAGVAYPTSKFAVNGFTLSLARELGPRGIRVNAVAPGITETDMMKAVPKEVIEPMIARIPLRRLGTPSDIANAFVFLASEEASYITGVVLSVDGLMRS